MYYTNGKLKKVVNDARTLIAKSRSAPVDAALEADEDRAVPKLTEGGIITLERTLTRLQTLLDAHYT